MMQGNHVHALGESITSGCEKWSNVSKKHYVEEAKSYTQPGSVAEKKAFFDAYYKKIAAQKAAAAALLEQEKLAAAANSHHVTSKVVDLAIENNRLDVNSKCTDSLNITNLKVSQTKRPMLKSKQNAKEEVTQPIIKKKSASSSWVASIHHRKDNINTPRAKNVITNDYTDKRRLAPKSETLVHPTDAGSKSTGPKWHILSAV
ncbi:hypothetical protein L1987_71832 [Smallanthus sonchifolius]|uniref:Uncharacterized protein n=1 Tax=Smallanthus sonchifolius TaxID=185202 RepID=A0ACB9AU70_9ASTR|nr:hypothetical protein L1987_71832 [Smallanthus sonchifolius]